MSEKVRSLDELRKIKQQVKDGTELREKGQNIENLIDVKVSMATCGIASGARETMAEMMEEAKARGLNNVVFTQCGCMGLCHSEPTVEVVVPHMPVVIYGNVDVETARQIVNDHIINKKLIDNHICDKPAMDIVR